MSGQNKIKIYNKKLYNLGNKNIVRKEFDNYGL
jgi:hypothetical protein